MTTMQMKNGSVIEWVDDGSGEVMEGRLDTTPTDRCCAEPKWEQRPVSWSPVWRYWACRSCGLELG